MRAILGRAKTLWLVTALAGLAGMAQGQTSAGAISGVVNDPSSASIISATVTLTNLATGEVRETKSGIGGIYQFLSVLPGRYRVAVEMAGFKRSVREPVVVEVQSSVRLDFGLEIGEVTQVVEVLGGQTPLIQADNATLGQVVEQRSVAELPLNGRNIYSLLAVVTSVVPMGLAGSSATGVNPFAWANFSIGGSQPNQGAQYLDNQPLNIPYLNLAALVPTTDSIQEFKVQTNNLGPEWGRFSGGTITLSTKTGSNQFRGTLYEYLRNRVLNANSFFANANRIARLPFTQNQFGGNLGGRVIRDRTFFFASYEGFRVRQATTFVETVPTAQQISGDFQGIATIYDATTTCGFTGGPECPAGVAPGTRQPFAGNRIPASRIDSAALKVLTMMYPPPTNPDRITNNWVKGANRGGSQNQIVARIDHILSPRQSLYARASWWKNLNIAADPYGTGACVDQCDENYTTKGLAIGYNYTLTPSILLDLSAGVLRFTYMRKPRLSGFDLSALGGGWTSAFNVQVPAGMRTPPVIVIEGMDSTAQPVVNSAAYAGYGGDNATQYNFSPNVAWIKGRHTLKFGSQLIAAFDSYSGTVTAPGRFDFNARMTAATPGATTSGYGLASYLLGYAASGSATIPAMTAARSMYQALYFGDTWRVTDKLTVTPGLRWELLGPWTERYNRLSWFDRGAASSLAAASGLPGLKGEHLLVASAARKSRHSFPVQRTHFGPRLGIAYQLNPKTAIRSGYGLFWVPIGVSNPMMPLFDPLNQGTTRMLASYDDLGAVPLATFRNPWPAYVEPCQGGCANYIRYLYGMSITAPDPNDYHYAYNQQWNFNIQREMAGEFFLDLSYAGSKGTHLFTGSMPISVLADQYLSLATQLAAAVANPFRGLITNPGSALTRATTTRGQMLRPYPQYSAVNLRQPGILDNIYHSLQMSTRRRLRGNGTFLASYTFSKSIGTAESITAWLESAGGTGGAGVYQNWNNIRGERAVAAHNVPHRLVISYVVDLPFGQGQRYLSDARGAFGKIISGWGVNGITTLQSGFLLKMRMERANSVANFGNGITRPNRVCSDANIAGPAQARLLKWFDTACFVSPPDYTYGDAPRAIENLRQAGINNFDFTVFKTTAFGPDHRYGLQFRAEMFNLFNRVQFGPPNTMVGARTYGQVTSQVNQPRLVQLALRFMF